MDKNTFLKDLSKGLSRLPNKERKVLLDFYGELIDDKIEGGQSESEVIASFGSVNVLVERLLIENPNRKKIGCFYLLIGAILVMILGVAALFLSFSNTEYSTNEDVKVANNGTIDSSTANSSMVGDFTVLSYNSSDISEVSLEADVSEIIVQKSQDDKINIKYKEYEDEFNKVEVKGRKLEFDNELKTNKMNKKPERTIYLELPEDFNGYLDIGADLGEVKMAEFNLTKIDISTNLGTIDVQDCTATDIDLSSDIGTVSIKNTTSERSFEASSDMGTVEFSNIDSQIIELSTDMGSIKGNLLGRKEEYSIFTELGMGKSNIQNQNGGTKSLQVSTDMGSIDISFGK